MKNKINIILLTIIIGVTPLIIGCKTTSSSPQSSAEIALGYVKPATTLACVAAIESEKPENRQKLAKNIFDISLVIESLTAGKFPTAAELKSVLDTRFPNDTKWIALAVALRDIYANALEQLKSQVESEQATLAFKYLHELAAGCRQAAEMYLVVTPPPVSSVAPVVIEPVIVPTP